MLRITILLRLLPLLLCSCIVVPVHAKEQASNLIIDLSTQLPGTTLERPVHLSGKTHISILLMNVRPGGEYRLSFLLDNAELPVMTLRSDQEFGDLVAGTSSGGSEKGNTIQAVASSSEQEDPSAETFLPLFSDNYEEVPEDVRYYLPDLLEMRPGQRLTVRVSGPVEEGSERRGDWTTIFNGGTRGTWQVSLGLGSPVLLDGHHRYATEFETETDKFRIVERRSEEVFELIPAVFFHWTPTADELTDWSWSMTGGLGLDFDNAVLFLGGAVTFNRNITLSVGGVAHQVQRLNPKYEVGELLPVGLDTDQLHTDYYRVNPYVGVTFRLSSNIFKGL